MAKRKFNIDDRVLVEGLGEIGIIKDYYSECAYLGARSELWYEVKLSDGRIFDCRAKHLELAPFSVYLASGWFSDEQEHTRLNCLNVLEEFSDEVKIFSPKDEVICPSDAKCEVADTIYKANVDAIHKAGFVVCNTTGKDMGTLHESGIASEAGIPVIYYAELPAGAKFNLMLARSGVAVATNPEELRAIIQYYKDHDWNFKKKFTYNGLIE